MKNRLDRLFIDPNREDILYFLETDDVGELEMLYAFADEVRKQFVGDAVHLRAIIEFSNYCRRGCRYCGLSKDNLQVTRYRMKPEEIVATARGIYQKGYRTIVLQSGEDSSYTLDDYLYITREIKKIGDLALTLAWGEKTEEEYRAYYEAGADRFLLKHETSNPELYRRLNPGMELAERIECLRALKRIGFQVGSGIMVGLPGQTNGSIADDILLFRELGVDMVGCGPFVSHPQTPLGEADNGGVDLSFRVLALNRIALRHVHLPATTALSTLGGGEMRRLALERGANVVMPNLTPENYRRLYDIYPNKKRTEVGSTDFREELETLVTSLNRFIPDTPY